MVWKVVNNTDPGDATHFGGDDRDKISNLFNGILNVDSVDINSLWKFRDNKLELSNPANTFGYFIRSAAILADVDLILPALTANDTVVTQAFAQTLTNKTIDGDLNTILDINETQMNVSVGAAATVLTSNGVGLAPTYQAAAGGGDMILAAAQTVSGAKTFLDGTMLLRNVANTFNVEFNNTVTANRIIEIPDAAGTMVLTGLIDQLTNTELTSGVFAKITGIGAQSQTLNMNGNSIDNISFFNDNSANPALSGVGRFGTNTFLAFRNAGNTGDEQFGFNTHANNRFVLEWDSTIAQSRLDIINNATAAIGADIAAIGFAGLDDGAALTTYGLIVCQSEAIASPNEEGHVRILAREAGGAIASYIVFNQNASHEIQIAKPFDANSQNFTNMGTLNTHTIPGGTDTIALLNATQTLASKTLTTPTIASFVNATHDHQAAAGGGTLLSTAALSDTANIAYLNTTNTYGDGLKQIFNPNATNAGLNVGSHAGQPSTPAVGDIIYNSTAGEFQGWDGAWINLGAGAGGGEANTIASLGGGTALTAAVPKSGVQLQTVSIATTGPLTHSVTTDLLTFDINDLVNADIAAGAAIVTSKLADAALFVLNNQANTYTGGGTQNFGGADLLGIEDITMSETGSIRTLQLERLETLVDDTDIGVINFRAFDGGAAADNYAQIRGVMAADGVGIEDGDLFISVIHDGALDDLVKIGDNGGVTSFQATTEFLIQRRDAVVPDFSQVRQQVLADGTAIGTHSWQGLNNLATAVRLYADIGGVMEVDTDGAEEGSFAIEVMEGGTPQTVYMDFNAGANGIIRSVKNLDLLANQLLFGTDGHSIVPAATSLTFDLGAATDDYIFQTAAATRLTISDTIVNAASGVTFQENGTDISPIGVHDQWLGAGNFIAKGTTPPASGVLDTRELPTNDVNISYWDFTNAGGIQGIQGQFGLPRNFDNTNISIRIYWTPTGASTGDVAWKVRLNAFSNSDPLDAAFAAEVEITDTWLANDDVHVADATALTVPTWIDADFAIIQIERNPADAQDTIDDTSVQFLGAQLYITTDAAVAA